MKTCVFAYGTLCDAKVRKEVIGYETLSVPDRLKGFKLDRIMLENIEYPILIESETESETINGQIFEVWATDLNKIDAYETDAYRRKQVKLESGISAWVYIK